MAENQPNEELDISVFSTFIPGENYPLKLKFLIKNNTTIPITIESKAFKFRENIAIDPNLKDRKKPKFFIGYRYINGPEINSDIYTLKPNESIIGCWIAIDKHITKEKLDEAIKGKIVGIWTYCCYLLREPCVQMDYYLEV